MTAAVVSASRPAPRRRSTRVTTLGKASGLGLGVAMIWFSLLVLIPLAAVIVTASQGGWTAFWNTITNEQTAAAIRLTVTPCTSGHGGERRDGHPHRMGPRPRPVQGPAHPRGPHRHPVRAPDHRGGSGAPLALRPQQPDRRGRRQHPSSGHARVPLRDPPVRGAHGPARPRRAGPGGGGGRRVPRREPVHHLPTDRAPQPDPRHRRWRGAVVRAGPSASTARSCCCPGTSRSRPRSPRCGS